VIIQVRQATTVLLKRLRLYQVKAGMRRVLRMNHPNRNPTNQDQNPNHLHLFERSLLNLKPLQAEDLEPHQERHQLIAVLRKGRIVWNLAEETEWKNGSKDRYVNGPLGIAEGKVPDQ